MTMTELPLKSPSSTAWLEAVMDNFDEFLLDHAANERKASAMAMSMVAHYPDRTALVTAMIDLALEELNHFRQVTRIVTKRGLQLAGDEKDPYVNRLRQHVRKGADNYLLDRLLSASVIECRGAERFATVAEHLRDAELAGFYRTLAASESNHHELFIDLAANYFSRDVVDERLEEWLQIETTIVDQLEVRPRLH
jgi:tRNA-(ms[2]io[6]A)-hydroxylase